MPRLQTIDIDLADASLTGFLSNATGATWTLTTTATTDGLARQVSIRNDSATDHSAKTAILVGTDADGRAQTETINLPGTSATVESTKYFATLTSVTPSATIGSDTMDIGWVDEAASKTIRLNRHSTTGALLHLDVTGTIDVTAQVALVNPDDYADQNAIPWIATQDTDLVGATADVIGSLDTHASCFRLLVNSHSSAAEVQAYISQGYK